MIEGGDVHTSEAARQVANARAAVLRGERPVTRFLRNVFDLGVAIPACLVLSPLFALLALAIKLDSSGPVFFRQTRRGRNFETFRIFKFRSLRHGLPDPHTRYEMLETDPRITRVGGWLRRTSLDELPQLFNVLAGSMSLVGPRPLVEWESQQARAGFPERFLVKPGLTGWAQVTVRNSVGFDERCEKDVEYVKRRSLPFDVLILVMTPWAMLRRDSIYPEGPQR